VAAAGVKAGVGGSSGGESISVYIIAEMAWRQYQRNLSILT
jgi:hypothetical protein